MKKYFTWNSTLFTIISLGSIIIGSPIWLLISSILTIAFLIVKSGLPDRDRESDEGGIWWNFFWTLLFGITFGFMCLASPLVKVQKYGYIIIGIILFSFWFYIIYKLYSK